MLCAGSNFNDFIKTPVTELYFTSNNLTLETSSMLGRIFIAWSNKKNELL